MSHAREGLGIFISILLTARVLARVSKAINLDQISIAHYHDDPTGTERHYELGVCTRTDYRRKSPKIFGVRQQLTPSDQNALKEVRRPCAHLHLQMRFCW